MEESLRAKNKLDSSSCFDTIPTCDRRAYRLTKGRTNGHDDSIYRASSSIASCVKNESLFVLLYQKR